ncbi:hypothetical protein KJ910_01625 [Patescibacteria group bacterium]|nr:hypothetical protein [Patescibacteria group bacterium]MBU1907265.1 hypothetical protein [Patescibacteria group bacterium]
MLLVMGLIILAVGIAVFRWKVSGNDRELMLPCAAVIVVGVLLIMIQFMFFFRI